MNNERNTDNTLTKRGKIIIAVFIVLVFAFLLWWRVPRSFEGITGFKGIQPEMISCMISPEDIDGAYARVVITDPEETTTVISYLKSSKYIPDVRYPLRDSVVSSDAYDGRTIHMSISDPENEYWKYRISFIDSNVMAVDVFDLETGSDGGVYVPLESALFDRLYSYIERLEPEEITEETQG